ncbi:MAG: aminomethyl-transferring glycine dehydrogenase subunit GcvPB [Candidatus Omnitrophica bacterium]|nr:aminomethyl-transferring glycine dehydrogenase subunit GcvPB [Candidatus Omnitrophota bacterium]MCM8826168.1 aminomethyl-transferring glycine dehydrogenase subunit GcvPB [Candidatus Omnitrophota bacterium]
MDKRLIFEKSDDSKDNKLVNPPDIPLNSPESIIPKELLREDLPLPSLGELDVVRHYTNLSKLNFSVDTNFYPLGSCTMKYNPKVNEDIAKLKTFTHLHPYQPESYIQGALKVIYELEKLLCVLTGMARFSFQPPAGASGEFTGMMIIRAYHKLRKEKRYKVIIPDSSHGTNPATASMCGYKTVVVPSTKEGLVDIDNLRKLVDEETSAMMLTNPNTLGLFEERILDISEIVHSRGALLYYDGANFNALLGITKPSLMGFDVIHLNLHKTFSTPHGSGGPGSAGVGVKEELKEFLPVPLVDIKNGRYYLNYKLKNSIGKVKSFYGNFNVLVKAYAYILRLGEEGLKRVSKHSVLNANYLREKLKDTYKLASPNRCMHELVLSCIWQKEKGVKAGDIAKRLIDFGIHPPTMYFPLIVKEALMIEPTETESKSTLDYFIQIMKQINDEVNFSPENFKNYPLTTPVRRVDETYAARFPDIRWKKAGV